MKPTRVEPGQPLYHRRTRYRMHAHKQDYLVSRHLQTFFDHALPGVVLPGSRLLDVGCGEQPLRALVERLGASYEGCDVTQNASNTVSILASASEIPAADASYDVILCTEVLEHVYDVPAAYGEFARLLRPGGTLVVTTPFFYPLHEEPFDFTRMTPHFHVACIKASGFTPVQVSRAGNALEVLGLAWCLLFPSDRTTPWPLKLLYSCLRLPVNLAIHAASKLFERSLSQKMFLSTLVIAKKGEGA